MDAMELLRYQVRQTWDWLDMTMSDVTEEAANWQPPGIANSIAATYAHTMIAADEDFNKVLAGGQMLLTTAWKDRCGLSELPPDGVWDWQAWAKRMHMDLAAFRQYAAAVRQTVESWLDRMTLDLLARDVDMTPFGLGAWKGLEIFNLHVHHPRIHGGEIACLKGMQGATGWATRQPTPAKLPEIVQ